MKRLLIVLLLIASWASAECDLKEGFNENTYYIQVKAVELYDAVTPCGMEGSIRAVNAISSFFPDYPEGWTKWTRRTFNVTVDTRVWICSDYYNCVENFDLKWYKQLKLDDFVIVETMAYKDPKMRAAFWVKIYKSI